MTVPPDRVDLVELPQAADPTRRMTRRQALLALAGAGSALAAGPLVGSIVQGHPADPTHQGETPLDSAMSPVPESAKVVPTPIFVAPI